MTDRTYTQTELERAVHISTLLAEANAVLYAFKNMEASMMNSRTQNAIPQEELAEFKGRLNGLSIEIRDICRTLLIWRKELTGEY